MGLIGRPYVVGLISCWLAVGGWLSWAVKKVWEWLKKIHCKKYFTINNFFTFFAVFFLILEIFSTAPIFFFFFFAKIRYILKQRRRNFSKFVVFSSENLIFWCWEMRIKIGNFGTKCPLAVFLFQFPLAHFSFLSFFSLRLNFPSIFPFFPDFCGPPPSFCAQPAPPLTAPFRFMDAWNYSKTTYIPTL